MWLCSVTWNSCVWKSHGILGSSKCWGGGKPRDVLIKCWGTRVCGANNQLAFNPHFMMVINIRPNINIKYIGRKQTKCRSISQVQSEKKYMLLSASFCPNMLTGCLDGQGSNTWWVVAGDGELGVFTWWQEGSGRMPNDYMDDSDQQVTSCLVNSCHTVQPTEAKTSNQVSAMVQPASNAKPSPPPPKFSGRSCNRQWSWHSLLRWQPEVCRHNECECRGQHWVNILHWRMRRHLQITVARWNHGLEMKPWHIHTCICYANAFQMQHQDRHKLCTHCRRYLWMHPTRAVFPRPVILPMSKTSARSFWPSDKWKTSSNAEELCPERWESLCSRPQWEGMPSLFPQNSGMLGGDPWRQRPQRPHDSCQTSRTIICLHQRECP